MSQHHHSDGHDDHLTHPGAGSNPEGAGGQDESRRKRYRALLAGARQLGGSGAFHARAVLPMALQLMRHSGRRLRPVRNLRWRDICLERGACEAVLEQGFAPMGSVHAWPYGVIHWRREHAKMDAAGGVIPINRELHRALRVYRDETWLGLVQSAGDRSAQQAHAMADMPVLPSPVDSTQPVASSTLRRWLDRARRQAQMKGPGTALTSAEGFHLCRRLWMQERKGFL